MACDADSLILRVQPSHASRRRLASIVGAAVLALALGTLIASKWMDVAVISVLLLILGAEFVNGWTDAPNAIATVVGTRTLSPRQALGMAAGLNLVGVMSGTAVATTIGTGIIVFCSPVCLAFWPLRV